jgi:phosphatidylglycerophosphate synthase
MAHSPYLRNAWHMIGWSSELGKHLDPAADKLLLVTVFVCLSVAGLVPWWLTAIVLLRDIVIVVGAGIYRALFGPVRGEPTLQSKLNTVCQILFCLAVVSSAAFAWPPEPVIATLGALVFITTCLSVGYATIFAETDAGKAIASFVMTFGPALSGAALDPSASEKAAEAAESVAVQKAILAKLEAIHVELKARAWAVKGQV